MIPIEEAEKIIDKVTFEPGVEEVPLMKCLGRVLAEDVVSAISMPPFDKSAMDGYALASGDDSGKFRVVEVIAAGDVPRKTIGKGECAKIMTGAMLPPGADRVVKVEVTEEKDGFMMVTGEDPNVNICYLGEDIEPGDLILKKGHLIRPPETGIIASMGLDTVKVYKPAKVAVVTTGSEIVPPGRRLEKGQIYNSNAYSISAQAMRCGAEVIYAGMVADDPKAIEDKFKSLLEQVDLLLISGGVSMGDFDFVPATLKRLGVSIHFEKVAIQPGKPTVFGTYDEGRTVIFGLPGNPVSTFTIFEVFVRRVLYRMMGHEYTPVFMIGKMKRDFLRRRGERTLFTPVRYDLDGMIEPVEYHGSAHLAALGQAGALLRVPAGVNEILKGTVVHVRQI